MHDFQYRGDELYCEKIPIRSIAEEIGTPLYLYSLNTLESHFRAFQNAFSQVDHLVCFSAKANSNIAILRVFSRMGGGNRCGLRRRTLPGYESWGQAREDRLFRRRKEVG